MAIVLSTEQVNEKVDRLRNDPLYRPTYDDFANVIATISQLQNAYDMDEQLIQQYKTMAEQLMKENARYRDTLERIVGLCEMFNPSRQLSRIKREARQALNEGGHR